MSVNKFIEKAIKQAKNYNTERGLKIGTLVGHDSRNDVMKLIRIEQDKGIVLIHPKRSPTGRELEMAFPLSELYDANLVKNIAEKLFFKEIQAASNN